MSLDPPQGTVRPPLRVVGEDGELRAMDETGSPYPKASLLLRFGARVFDVAVAWGLYVTAGQAGSVVALLYLLLGDGMLNGQSPGKKLCGIKVIYLPTRTAARYRDSVLRNAPFALIILLGMMPDPLGPVAALAGMVAIGGVEAWKVYRDPLGIRLGDVWGQTQVIDGKVVVGALNLAPTAEAASAEAQLRVSARKHSNRQSAAQEEPTCASR
jgi:hypothetical protein